MRISDWSSDVCSSDLACEETAKEVRALGRRALAIAAHAGDWGQVEALAERAYAEWGRIDILVNNAGMSPVEPSSVATTEALFDKVVSVNFKGPFRLAAVVGTRMAQGDGGTIITVSRSEEQQSELQSQM